MRNLYRRLHSFSSDYAGAANVLSHMGGIVALCDGGGCLGHVLERDEIGYSKDLQKIFSANLREIDIVMGNDKKLVEKMLMAWEKIGGEYVALLGTPVPSFMGLDGTGLKIMAEQKQKISFLWISTTGLDFYDKGEQSAYLQLIQQFAQNKGRTGSLSKTVHILGATHLDMWEETSIEELSRILKNAGAEDVRCWGYDCGTEAVKCVGNSCLNIALSWAAVRSVKELEQKFGTPWVAGVPMGRMMTKKLDLLTRNALLNGTIEEHTLFHISHEKNDSKKGLKILIIGEQISSCSLRQRLRENKKVAEVDVVSYFSMEKEYMEEKDRALVQEHDLDDVLKSNSYDLVIGDPVFREWLNDQEISFLDYPHIPVSGNLYYRESLDFTGERADLFIDMLIEYLENNGQGIFF